MTAQPTPAPWSLMIATIEGATVATIEPADGPYRGMIARLQSAEHIDGIGADELIANAHLLVAARGLLDFVADFAAADFAGVYSHTLDPQDEPDPLTDATTVWDWQSDARDLVLKARGKS